MRSKIKRGRRGDAGATPAGRKACDREKESETAPTLDLPIADEGAITSTTVYLTIEQAFVEEVAALPFYEKYSPETREVMKWAFFKGASEMMRTVVFRANAEENGKVFDDLDAEIQAFDAELRRKRNEHDAIAERADSQLH